MQTEDLNTDDLDFLSKQGFDLVNTEPNDLDDLKKRVRLRAQSAGSSSYFYLIWVLLGIIIGMAIFFVVDKDVPSGTNNISAQNAEKDEPDQLNSRQAVILLDTLEVKEENFLRKDTRHPKTETTAKDSTGPATEEVVISIPRREINIAETFRSETDEEKLKFILNAPVFYLHDLKITDYTGLYFKRNRFVRLEGTSAAYAGKNEAVAGGLKENADYFLHEEIAEAMLHYKKGRYDLCIAALNLVSTFNKEDLNCDFYLGMCFYQKRKYAKAIEYLDRCIININNTFLQEATFYKALALLESGDKKSAEKILQQIADEGEFYAAKARTYLNN